MPRSCCSMSPTAFTRSRSAGDPTPVASTRLNRTRSTITVPATRSIAAIPDLRAAHAAMPFVVTWNDHEVANGYAGTKGVATADPRGFLARRGAAFQAYLEHMPLDPATLRPGGKMITASAPALMRRSARRGD